MSNVEDVSGDTAATWAAWQDLIKLCWLADAAQRPEIETLVVQLREMQPEEAERKNKFRTRPSAVSIAALSPRGY